MRTKSPKNGEYENMRAKSYKIILHIIIHTSILVIFKTLWNNEIMTTSKQSSLNNSLVNKGDATVIVKNGVVPLECAKLK